MKLPASAHSAYPWRIHDLAPDFRVEDVWALPTPGGIDDFARLVDQFAVMSFPDGAPWIVRKLWAARWRIGEWLGWDEPGKSLDARVSSLRDRLPADSQEHPKAVELPADHPFTSIYQFNHEYAAETANATVHIVLHLAWVPEDAGGYRGQMTSLVKPNGRFGNLYMRAIKPIRYLIVYPALMDAFKRDWDS